MILDESNERTYFYVIQMSDSLYTNLGYFLIDDEGNILDQKSLMTYDELSDGNFQYNIDQNTATETALNALSLKVENLCKCETKKYISTIDGQKTPCYRVLMEIPEEKRLLLKYAHVNGITGEVFFTSEDVL